MRSEQTGKSICIIIPTFNREKSLRTLLKQIHLQEATNGFTVGSLVVDDGSTDGTADMMRTEFPDVPVLKGPGNWWWTRSINEGIKYAFRNFNPDYLLLLNDDSQIEPDYLGSLIRSSQNAGDKSIIGSISITDKSPYKVSFSGVASINWVSLKRKHYHKSFELLENIPASGLFPTYALNGRGTFLSAELMKDLELLNEKSFPQYGSDDDLALRAWRKGYKVFISYSCRIYDSTFDTSKGSAFRQDSLPVFVKSFFRWNSVNYIPKQWRFFYSHGIKFLLPYYMFKFILGTSYAYFFKYKKMKHEV
jgi:GT2 family glycosyltransferase